MNRNILTSQSSSSYEAMKKTYNLSILNGGVTQDSPSNIENIREVSRKLDTNILPVITTRNLLKYSEDFTQSVWSKDRVTLVPNQIANPINGLVNASLLTIDTNNNTHRLQYTAGELTVQNSTVSVYLKKNTHNLIQLNGPNSPQFINFDLNSGSVVNSGSGVVSSSVESLTNGWYRCIVTFNTIGTSNISILFIQNASDTWRPSFLGNGTNSVYVWGVQLERNTVATLYQPTKYIQTNLELTSANFLFVPSSYGEGKVFSQNPNLRNIVPFSEECDNGLWSKTQSTVTPNATIAPNGTMTADKFVETAALGPHTLRTSLKTITGNHISSIYLKAGERTEVNFGHGTGGSRRMNIDLITGAFTISPSPQLFIGSVTNVGNGWWRASFFTKSPHNNEVVGVHLALESGGTETYTGDGVSGIYVWGAQLEASATPEATQYQRTTDGISDFTFTRTTSSRVTNKLGIIEDSCYNLITNSDPNSDIGATLVSNITYSTFNWGVNGLVNSTVFVDNAVNRVRYMLTNPPIASLTISFYIKMNDGSEPIQGLTTGTGDFGIVMESGLINFPATKQYVGNSIWMVSATKTYTGGASSTGVIKYSTMSNKGFICSGYQFAIGNLRPYLRTTDRLNVPCLDYSRSLLEPSLMIEPQRTNLLRMSETITDGLWLKGNTTVTLNSNLNPFGVNKSYYLTEDNLSSDHTVSQSVSITSGTSYVSSFYVKKASHTWVQFVKSTSSWTDTWANFNFDTGLFGNKGVTGTWEAKQLTNGYWLITNIATATTTASASPCFVVGTNNTNAVTARPVYVGTNANICDIAAIQSEAGSNATSYIPTTTATVTRNGETAYVDLWNNNMLFQTNWSLYWEGYLYNGQTTAPSFCLSDTNTAASNTNQIGWIDTIQPFYNISSTRTNGVSTTTSNSFNKFMIQYDNGIANFFINGNKVLANQSVPVFDYRYLVLNNGGSTFATDKICLFNRTLSLGECINLTNPNYNTFEALASAYTYTLII
jgi:hypothetical protein